MGRFAFFETTHRGEPYEISGCCKWYEIARRWGICDPMIWFCDIFLLDIRIVFSAISTYSLSLMGSSLLVGVSLKF